jgi:hypothetical protein
LHRDLRGGAIDITGSKFEFELVARQALRHWSQSVVIRPPARHAAVGPLHGYAVAQRLEQVSRGVVQVPEGSLYPALHRLENRGFLAARWRETETCGRRSGSL